MAKVYYYSKRYSQQGAAIKAVTYNDLFLLSRAVPVNPPFKLGYRTYSTTLNTLKNYTIEALKNSSISFQYGEGLMGSGSAQDPLRVDKDWVNQTYIRSVDWPFSQIGDPTDATLPIAGSYFSVCYPFLTNCPGTTTPYAEGNGDLRMLRHVTNGEQVAVVYSTWKNYKNTPVGTTVHSDTVYRPPGLAADEFIFHVHTATDTAMIVEIHSYDTGFREHAFVILNGTLMAESHKLVRLGKTLLTGLLGGTVPINTWLQYYRLMNVCAVIVKDVKYVFTTTPMNTDVLGTKAAVRVILGRVSDLGEVTRINGWTATNSEGSTRTDQYYAVLNGKVTSYDPLDKDGLVYSASPASELTVGFAGVSGVAAPTKITAGGVNSKGYVTFSTHHYLTHKTWKGETDIKPMFFYDIDFDNHRIIPANGATGRRWTVATNAAGDWLKPFKTSSYHEGHYWAGGILLGMLNNGDRFAQYIPGSADVTQQFTVIRGNVTSLDTVGDDTNYVNAKRYNNVVRVTPPTTTKSTYRAVILHNKLRVLEVGGPNAASFATGKSLALLSGSYNAKTYKLLPPNTFGTATDYVGYELNDSRVAIIGNQNPAIYAFRKNGSLYYHNASWSSNDAVTAVCYWGIDANSVGQYQFKMLQTVADKLTAIMTTFPLQAGHSQVNRSYWAITPFYPNIGEPYALVRFLQTYRTPDSSSSNGWAMSRGYQQFIMVPMTLVIDSLNVATMTDIDLSGFVVNLKPGNTSNNYGNQGIATYGSMAFDISSTGYEILYRGGTSDYNIANSAIGPVSVNYVSFDANRNLLKNTWSAGGRGYDSFPTISPTHGLGLVYTAGLGAFYVFSKYLPDTNGLDTTTTGSYILGTARPAAGFNVTVNAPFPVYVEGHVYTVGIQGLNLTNVSSSYKNTTFYCYVVIRNGVAKFEASKTVRPETLHCIYIGYIKTSDTEITEINCTPITRWETSRASVYPIGNAFPVSTGLPHEKDVKVWENTETIDGTPAEYMWGADDIIDSDTDYIITDLYWAYDQAGESPVNGNSYYGEEVYLIVKTNGISDYVEVTFDRNELEENDMEIGAITSTVKVPLSFNVGANTGFGFYKVKTLEMDDMAFNNATWLDVTARRAVGTDYTNSLKYAIQVNISIKPPPGGGKYSLMVDGVITAIGAEGTYGSAGGANSAILLSAIVPANAKYNLAGTGGAILSWAELGRR